MTSEQAKNTIDSITVIDSGHFNYNLKEILYHLIDEIKDLKEENKSLRYKINSIDNRTMPMQRVGMSSRRIG